MGTNINFFIIFAVFDPLLSRFFVEVECCDAVGGTNEPCVRLQADSYHVDSCSVLAAKLASHSP